MKLFPLTHAPVGVPVEAGSARAPIPVGVVPALGDVEVGRATDVGQRQQTCT